jgi:hypothetical protein
MAPPMIGSSDSWMTQAGEARTLAGPVCTRWSVWSTARRAAGGPARATRPVTALEDLSAEDRRALTELLVDKIIIAPHPHKIVDGRRHYTIRAIPYQDPRARAERLKAVHEARVKIVPRV